MLHNSSWAKLSVGIALVVLNAGCANVSSRNDAPVAAASKGATTGAMQTYPQVTWPGPGRPGWHVHGMPAESAAK